MPYRDKGPWFYQVRRYLREIKPTIDKDSLTIYDYRLDRCGRVLGYPDPMQLKLPTLRALESQLPGAESNRCILAHTLRTFLDYIGNREAKRWKIALHTRPKVGGVFLSEDEITKVRQVAESLGPLHHLLFSLGVDNGLRCVDMRNLTMLNASELTRYRRSEIRGKGRNGGKVRHLELSKMTEQPLGSYLSVRRSIIQRWKRDWDELIIYERVYPPADAMPISYKCIKEAIREISEAVGIQFDPHDLRRTYGHRLHDAGVPLETIAKLMGHESITQSFRAYIGIDQDEMRAAQDRLVPR